MRSRSRLTNASGRNIRLASGGTVSCVDGSSDPLKTGHVLCGNEFIHAELVKIIKGLEK